MSDTEDISSKKRKLQDGPELEIDVDAPEPVSKKALRKAKKNKDKGIDTEDAEKPKSSKSSKSSKHNDIDDTKDLEEEATPSKRSEYGVWIGNLSFTVTREELRMFFTANSDISESAITRIHLPKGPERFGRPQNRGFAYVDFTNKKALKEAIGLSEQLMTGRRVLIKDAKSYEGRPEKSERQENAAGAAAKPGHPPSKRLFVGNLSFDVTKESLEENFSKCGKVNNVHMATFQDTGKCKGYAWVEFEELAAAEAAVRGFVLVKEDDGQEDDPSDSESDSATEKKKSKKLKPKMNRIWVNQLFGRRMRMEFAEDASTRYKKRFGKDAEKKDGPAITEEGAPQEKPRYKKRSEPIDESRYSKETVQKLSGGIVEAQGKKVTFD
ncbi:Nucleotide-binding [Penicillium brevicompactum]